MQQNQRKRTRIAGRFDASITVDACEARVITQNLSLKGLLCEPKDDAPPWEKDAPCTVRLTLSDTVDLTLEGRIVRSTPDAIAVDFTGMDETTYAHLRNIIRFSADDPDAIDTEQIEKPFVESP